VPVRLVEVDVTAAPATALRRGLYAYDAYVLEAARAQRAPLLTLHKALARSAAAEGLPLVEVTR
jgi:predicted nucleic acid-binding protein